MSETTESALIQLIEELLEKGDFFHSAIESNDMMFDLEKWKERVELALQESKSC